MFAFLVLLLVPAALAKECPSKPADIVFVIDGSGSEGNRNFGKQLEFIQNFTQQFTIGPNSTLISVLPFGTTPHNGFWLDDHTDKASLLTAISRVHYPNGETYTDLALNFVEHQSLSSRHGARSGVPKYVIVMTDGRSNNQTATALAAAHLKRKSKVTVMAIGIGGQVEQTELEAIASDRNHVFSVNSFDALNTVQDELTTTTCNECALKPADIIFVIDGSGSEGPTNFRKQLSFIQNFTDTFIIGPHQTQVSVLPFGTTPHNAFYLNAHADKRSLRRAISNVHYPNGETYTDLALKFVLQNSLSRNHGARDGIPKYVIVLTDGRSNNQTATAIAATDLKMLPKVSIVAIGIGSQVDQAELDNIATDHKHVFSVNSFDALSTIQGELTTTTCSLCGDAPTDIIFMLDSSGSEGQDNFQKQLRFVEMVANEFEISPTETQVGVVTFSTSAANDIDLDQFSTKAALIQAVQRIQYRDGETNTHLGLRLVNTVGFLNRNGGRANAVKFLIVLTDGRSTEPDETLMWSKRIHGDNVEVFAIGIGPHIDQHELRFIATDKRHVFRVKNFKQLDAIHQAVFNRICENREVISTTPPPTTTTTMATTTVKADCGLVPADIVFVLDSSDSEGEENFRIQTDFVESFARQFAIGPNNIQFGLVTFSSDVNNVFWLNTYHRRGNLLTAIHQTPYLGAGTNTSSALQFVREESFTPAHGDRPNATNIAIVITDGRSSDANATAEEARLLHNVAEVFSIGIGPAVDSHELRTIGSGRHHSFSVNNFRLLHSIKKALTDTACAS